MKLIILSLLFFVFGCEPVVDQSSPAPSSIAAPVQIDASGSEMVTVISPASVGLVDVRKIQRSEVIDHDHMDVVISDQKLTGRQLAEINAAHETAYKEMTKEPK